MTDNHNYKQKAKVYGIGCRDCISYKSGPGYQATVSGLIDGQDKMYVETV
jgi:hypothetical protein